MKMLKELLTLCRPHQWYKNLLVFLALFFSGNLFNAEPLLASAYAFLILIVVSSANYSLNDVIDAKKDRHNTEKRKRPVASGKIKVWQAFLFAAVLLAISFVLSAVLSIHFFYAVLSLFVLTSLYSVALKKLFLADVIAISINFVIRAVAGALVISVFVSPWLVIGVFIFAFFLVTGKRYGEKALLGKKAGIHRKVLKHYTKEFSEKMVFISGILLLASFLLFAIFEHILLLWSFPLFAYLLARYFQVIKKRPQIAASPEKAFADPYLLITSIIFIMASVLLLYIK